tara:strand:- start:3217 stop:3450 length:234 start_codon:yes stop_codon:yes gene_type:complete
MIFSEEDKKGAITKPALHDTIRVLHNLWLESHISEKALDIILRETYSCKLQKNLTPRNISVESLDGLQKYSLGKEKE